jgi:hypothetical protein
MARDHAKEAAQAAREAVEQNDEDAAHAGQDPTFDDDYEEDESDDSPETDAGFAGTDTDHGGYG